MLVCKCVLNHQHWNYLIDDTIEENFSQKKVQSLCNKKNKTVDGFHIYHLSE